jgi:pyridoxal phosphate enzyme (YggS family)
MGDVAWRLARVRQAIDEAAERAGRPGAVTLVAVTKTMSPERVREAWAAGQRVFGENRVQEGTEKIAVLAEEMPAASWHLIGHLQSNKARSAVMAFSLIESVDSVRLARKLNDLAGLQGRRLPVLLEVNVGGEASKSGVATEEVWQAFPQLLELANLEVRGLMTVAPLVGNPEEVRPVFRRLRELRDGLRERFQADDCHELSMGMSDDFGVAIEEGATMVRIGRAIFGERPPA